MIARGFKSVLWVGAVGGAALSCYMVSLQVATERAELAKVEQQIIAAKRDIRTLQTELGTRGRLSQLEQWNAEVLALSAPGSAQFLPSEFTLARLEQRAPSVGEQAAQVRMASADVGPAPQGSTAQPTPPVVQTVASPGAAPHAGLVRTASFTPTAKPLAPPAAPLVLAQANVKPAAIKATPAKPQAAKAKAKPDSRTARIDSRLAAEIGAAARAEKVEGNGGN